MPELTTLKTDEPEEEVQIEQTSEETWHLGLKSQIPEAVSPSFRAPVGFKSEPPSAPPPSRPTRQLHRYGDIRRLSDYEDFENNIHANFLPVNQEAPGNHKKQKAEHNIRANSPPVI